MKTQKLLLTMLLLVIISWPSYSFARSGCCSSHGGVCGCGCCDGSSLSATCAPYYPECSNDSEDDYYAPTPRQKVVIPNPLLDVSLDYSVVKTGDNKFSVTFDWSDHNKLLNNDFSIRLAKIAGDPGPLVDTNKSIYTFTNVPAGTYVLSLKTKYIGTWTDDYVSWKNIYVSDKMSEDRKPSFASFDYTSQNPAVEPKCDSKISDDDTSSTWAFYSTLVTIILGISLIVIRNNKKKLENELFRLKNPNNF